MGLFDVVKNIFKSNKQKVQQTTFGDLSTFKFSNNFKIEDNNILNTAINTNARNFSKIQPQVHYKGALSKNKQDMNYILRVKPNPLINGPTFWEKVAYEYYMSSNVFIYPEFDYTGTKEPLKSLWIIPSDSIEIVENKGNFYYKFMLNGEDYYSESSKMIHLSRNIGTLLNSLGKIDPSIKKVVDLIETNNEGMQIAIKNSALIKYIINTATLMNDTEKKKRSESFAKSLNESTGGIAFIDGSESFQQIDTSRSKYMGGDTLELLKKQIYESFGVNEKIINSSYNEEEWQSYYESVLEPLVMKLETELTEKLLSKREREHNNEIIVSSNRLQTASFKTRLQVAQTIQKSPIHRPNDVLTLLYLDPIEGGDNPYVFLNYEQMEMKNGYNDINKKEEENVEE